MSARLWRFAHFDAPSSDGQGTKTHVVPAGLQRHLLADLAARGLDAPPRIKPTTKTSMDQPGMVHTDRPWELFRLPGLKFHIPSEDVLYFIERLQKLEQRMFAPGRRGHLWRAYFKLHSWCSCLVMYPVDKIALELQMRARLHEAERRANVFWADKKSPNQVLREVNAKLSNVPIEHVPSSPHPVERFIPKQRGQA